MIINKLDNGNYSVHNEVMSKVTMIKVMLSLGVHEDELIEGICVMEEKGHNEAHFGVFNKTFMFSSFKEKIK